MELTNGNRKLLQHNHSWSSLNYRGRLQTKIFWSNWLGNLIWFGLIWCIKNCINQKEFEMYATCELLLVKSANKEDYFAELEIIYNFYLQFGHSIEDFFIHYFIWSKFRGISWCSWVSQKIIEDPENLYFW